MNGTVSKTVVVFMATVGSNPTLSASNKKAPSNGAFLFRITVRGYGQTVELLVAVACALPLPPLKLIVTVTLAVGLITNELKFVVPFAGAVSPAPPGKAPLQEKVTS